MAGRGLTADAQRFLTGRTGRSRGQHAVFRPGLACSAADEQFGVPAGGALAGEGQAWVALSTADPMASGLKRN